MKRQGFPVSTIVDTVILRYFLLVDQTELLMKLVGSPIELPRIVYDREEGQVPPDAMSEMTRAIYDQLRKWNDKSQPDDVRASANKRMQRLHAVHSLHGLGHINVIDMTDSERRIFGRLTSRTTATTTDLVFPLAAGEAACVAIAVERDWTCATDDTDALHALDVLKPGHPYQRIRKLLQHAADEGIISHADATRIHAEMRRAGFWDEQTTFQ